LYIFFRFGYIPIADTSEASSAVPNTSHDTSAMSRPLSAFPYKINKHGLRHDVEEYSDEISAYGSMT
jgi:hypothetical protein